MIEKRSIIIHETETLNVAKLVATAGGRAFCVGGCVRDALLGVPSKDVDIEVYGLDAIRLQKLLESNYRVDLVGESFGVFKIHGFDIDVALPRRETKLGEGHKGFDIQTAPNLSFEEATSRRDFTINALMYDPLKCELIDCWGGVEDLQNGVLRHVSEHFVEDPLRVLRAMQFAARYDFEVAPETVALCKQIEPEGLPRERLAGEWEKLLLKGKVISRGMNFLRDCGWIKYYPELMPLIGCKQDARWHPEGDVWNHTLLALDNLPQWRTGNRYDDLVVSVAVLCHDFGKPFTTCFTEDGRITSYNHENAADVEVQSFISRLWNLNNFTDSVIRLVNAHMRPIMLMNANSTDKAFRKLSVDVLRMDLLTAVVACDAYASSPEIPKKDIIDGFIKKCQDLGIYKHPPKPIIQGRHLIELGVSPKAISGEVFGSILDKLYAAQIDGKFNDLDSAILYAKRNFVKGRMRMNRSLYVGSNSGDQGKGLRRYSIDGENKKLVERFIVDNAIDPIYLALSASGRYLYVAEKVNVEGCDMPGGVSVYSTDGGKLTRVAQYALAKTVPCHISLSSYQNYLLWAEYRNGTCGYMKVLPNGLLEPVASTQHQGCGINKERQESAHCHCAISTPTERYMCVCDLGIDQVVLYPLTGNASDFKKVSHIEVAPGAGPRHLIFKRNNAYLINELNNTVIAYRVSDNKFEEIAIYQTLPEDFNEFSKCAAIKISPNQKWLLASNRGHNSIAVFKINPDGSLERVVINMLGGEYPRDFSFYPDGSKIVVGHKMSDEFVVYDFDDETGAMVQAGECFKFTKPLAFVFD